MDKKIRIGIAGAGFIAACHLECVGRVHTAACEVVGVTDIIPEKREEFARQHGIRAFATLEEMLPHVDAVDVCTPPFAHAQCIIAAAQAGKHVICEKPLIGYSPDPKEWDNFRGDRAPKLPMLQKVAEEAAKVREAVEKSGVRFVYFENFIYTPHVQKEAEIIRKTGSQVLRMIGEESHFGNMAKYSSHWKYACGGSLISTGSHPIGALLYLKRVEGLAGSGKPIRPAAVSARTHALTMRENYRDEGFLRNDYHDVEDYGWAHIVFEDGTVGDIISGATVLGGVNDYVDVFANNHRSRLHINLSNFMETFNPGAKGFDGVFLNYMNTTNMGWQKVAVDDNWMFGYAQEMQDAMECFATGKLPEADLDLAVDATMTIYAAYLSAERKGQEVTIDVAEGK
jgi:predicted dehydrogenase